MSKSKIGVVVNLVFEPAKEWMLEQIVFGAEEERLMDAESELQSESQAKTVRSGVTEQPNWVYLYCTNSGMTTLPLQSSASQSHCHRHTGGQKCLFWESSFPEALHSLCNVGLAHKPIRHLGTYFLVLMDANGDEED